MAYLFTEILIIAGTQRYKRSFVKKTRAIKLDSGGGYNINKFTDVLT